jgi:hypothetical protein
MSLSMVFSRREDKRRLKALVRASLSQTGSMLYDFPFAGADPPQLVNTPKAVRTVLLESARLRRTLPLVRIPLIIS